MTGLGRISGHGENLERSLNMCFHAMFLFELTELFSSTRIWISLSTHSLLRAPFSTLAVAFSYAIALQPSCHNTALEYTHTVSAAFGSVLDSLMEDVFIWFHEFRLTTNDIHTTLISALYAPFRLVGLNAKLRGYLKRALPVSLLWRCSAWTRSDGTVDGLSTIRHY